MKISLYNEDLFEFFGNQDSIKKIQKTLKKVDIEACNDDKHVFFTENGKKICSKCGKRERLCSHTSIKDEDGINICEDCGCEIENLDFEPEWRYYGSADNRMSKDPSRCHKSKEQVKGNITKVFEDAKLELPKSIKKKTETKYKIIVGNDTVRGKGRKARVAACLLHALRDEGDIRTSDDVRSLFSLTKQEMSLGLTVYYEAFPKDRTQHATPSDFIRRVLQQTKIDFKHYKNILKIANVLHKVDPVLNRSTPHSVASAIVYLYICIYPNIKERTGLTKQKFAKAVGLSDITITKLVKTAATCLQLENLNL